MKSIKVLAESKEYPIYFSNNFENLNMAFETANLKNRKICVITDTNVSKIYGETIVKQLESIAKEVYIFEFEAGEKSKNIDVISKMYEFFIEKRLDRKSVVVALGGGVCGDMAGFSAATYMRGVPFVQIPTTLLSQVDSSVGGKVGIDFKGSKNIVGAFYQPEFVYINASTLKSLPKREYSAGMAEVIKYGPIWSEEFYNYIIENKEKLKNLHEETIIDTVLKCCEIKAEVVGEDEKESGLREILNFGHTIGHAVETVKDFELIHGECVSIGMVSAMIISQGRNLVSEGDVEKIIDILKYFNLPTTVENIEFETIYNQMFLDKKVKDNKIGFVLIDGVGKTIRTTDVTESEVSKGIEFILR